MVKLNKKREIQFTEDKPVSFGDIQTTVRDHDILEISNNSTDFVRHTVYVFNEKNNEILKLPYTAERTFTINLSGIEKATIVYFVCNYTGESLKGILGFWNGLQCKGNCSFTQNSPPIGPWGCSAYVEHTTDNQYICRIQVSPLLEANISWWVYRYGSLYKYVSNTEREYRAELNIPGSYVIMCSMRNKYLGEFFFYQSEKIIIK